MKKASLLLVLSSIVLILEWSGGLITNTTVFAESSLKSELFKVNEPGYSDLPKVQIDRDFSKLPLYFIPNVGQMDEAARFYTRASSYTLWITGDGLIFDKTRKKGRSDKRTIVNKIDRCGKTEYERDVSRLRFIGAEKDLKIIAGETTEHRVNYFIGNDRSKWHTNIRTSSSVMYKGIYRNVDLKIYGAEKQIEYDWIVHPGGDISDIEFMYDNVELVRISEDGNLVVHTDFGNMIHKKPVAYQMIEEKRIDVKVIYQKLEEGSYGFISESYDKKLDLIIDPVVLDYSTYLGGNDTDIGLLGIAVDASGAAYVAGMTSSSNFPTANPYQGTNQGTGDAFVTKLSPAGDSLTYSTYLGGSAYDIGYGITVDASGAAYVAGMTGSSNFPTANPYQGTYQGNEDAFVTKLRLQSPNVLPVPVIDADRFGGIAPVTITFDGSNSYDPDGEIVSWQWVFDGVDMEKGVQVIHDYTTPGKYKVTLTVKDSYGEWSAPAKAEILVLGSTDDLKCDLSVDPSSFKANGKGSGLISSILYQNSSVQGAGLPITVDMGLIFSASCGSCAGDRTFDFSSGKYTETLISGEPGDATVSAVLDGETLANATVIYTWPRPPINLSIEVDEDRGAFIGYYYVTLTWSANPNDIYETANFRIYRSTDGGEWQPLATVDENTFTYTDTALPAGSSYRYAVSKVDTDGDESEPAVIELETE